MLFYLSVFAFLVTLVEGGGIGIVPPPQEREPVVIFLGVSERVDMIPPNAQEENPAVSVPINRPLPPPTNSTPVASLDEALDDGEGASGMPDPIFSFEGIPAGGFVPDTVGDIGPNHYVQMVNILFAVFDRQGNQLVPPTAIGALFAGDDDCDGGVGDPIVLYDQFEDRWLLTQLACSGDVPNRPCFSCMAISTSGDPAGTYVRYKIQAQEDPNTDSIAVLPDYPKYSVWTDSYVLTTRDFGEEFENEMNETDRYFGTSVYAIEKAAMVAGSEDVGCNQFIMDDEVYGDLIGDGLHMLSADIDGSNLPPPGSPIPVLSSDDNELGGSTLGFDAINVWELTVDWAGSSASFAFIDLLEVAEFDSDIPGDDRADVELPPADGNPTSEGQKVDARPALLLHRLAYRNFGDFESMVTVRGGVERQGDGTPLGVRWFEIRRQGGAYSIGQQSTFSPDDGINRWMGSIAQDRVGNIAMGYSVASARDPIVFPGIRYAGRLVGDEPNKMTLGENSLIEGSATQTGSDRWGDYSSMNIDPVDDCTFWYTNQYYEEENGNIDRGNRWQTRVGTFVLEGCEAEAPTLEPSFQPSSAPSDEPSNEPSTEPSNQPSDSPSTTPLEEPSTEPSNQPSDSPSTTPLEEPSMDPSSEPSVAPSAEPSDEPSSNPSERPSDSPSTTPFEEPSMDPSSEPSLKPSAGPSDVPSNDPSSEPSERPSVSAMPTSPTFSPAPSSKPSAEPSDSPSETPSEEPPFDPSSRPSSMPSEEPVSEPSGKPSNGPSGEVSNEPSPVPSSLPSFIPTLPPSSSPAKAEPTKETSKDKKKSSGHMSTKGMNKKRWSSSSSSYRKSSKSSHGPGKKPKSSKGKKSKHEEDTKSEDSAYSHHETTRYSWPIGKK